MTTRRSAYGTRARNARVRIEQTLDRLERELPTPLARGVRELRRNALDVEQRLQKARAQREQRWSRLEAQLRRDLARLLRRAGRAVEPKPRRRTARAKRPAAQAAA